MWAAPPLYPFTPTTLQQQLFAQQMQNCCPVKQPVPAYGYHCPPQQINLQLPQPTMPTPHPTSRNRVRIVNPDTGAEVKLENTRRAPSQVSKPVVTGPPAMPLRNIIIHPPSFISLPTPIHREVIAPLHPIDTTVQGTTIPGATVPGATVSRSTVPQTTIHQPTVLGATVPRATVPRTTNQGAPVPRVTDPGATNPGAPVPRVTDPGATNPGAPVPGATVPGATVPRTTNQGAPIPRVTDPGATNPGATVPRAAISEITVSGAIISDVPEATILETTVPEAANPGATVPETTTSGTIVPETTIQSTVAEATETTAPEIATVQTATAANRVCTRVQSVRLGGSCLIPRPLGGAC